MITKNIWEYFSKTVYLNMTMLVCGLIDNAKFRGKELEKKTFSGVARAKKKMGKASNKLFTRKTRTKLQVREKVRRK